MVEISTVGGLRLLDDTIIDISKFTHADWEKLPAVGVEWVGVANLTRFVNEAGAGSRPQRRIPRWQVVHPQGNTA